MAPDSEVRQILIESLAFENANSECERVVKQDEWIRNTADIGSPAYDANSDRSDF